MKIICEYWLWSGILNNCYSMNDSALFIFDKDGLKTKVLNEGKFAILELFVPSSVFKYYEPFDEIVKISVGTLLKRSKGLEKNNVVEVEVERESLKVNLAGKFGHRIMGVPLLSLEEGEKEVLETEIKVFVPMVKVKVIADAVESAIKDAMTINKTSCYFEARKPDRFAIWNAEKGTFNSSWTEFVEPISMLGIEVNADVVRSMYSCETVLDIIRAGRAFTDVVRIEYAENLPVKFSFELPFNGRVIYYLAPIMEK